MTRSIIEQLDDEFVQNPYAIYERLRAEGPVSRVAMPGGHPVWVITRYADARAALADPRLVKDWRRLFPGSAAGPDDGFAALDTHMLSTDPPDHHRLRRLVTKAFTARRIEQLRPRVAEITASLLDAMPTGGQVDLLEAFAFPLPITVICELLGVPDSDRANFRAWTRAVLSIDDTSDEPETAAMEMAGYFTALVADKRARPADDLLSGLLAARDAGDGLSERELLGMIFLLLVAGHETTVNLIGSGTLALLLSPGEMARLRADRSLLPGAVEELLRYTSPVNHATFRFTAEPVEVGGTLIPAREAVLVAIGSANRDPGRYPAPDRLDIGRDVGGNLAFGHGIHYCLGAPLARMEGEIAFGGLLSRFPGMALAVPPESLRWRPSTLIHGLETLPVRLSLRGPPRSNGRGREPATRSRAAVTWPGRAQVHFQVRRDFRRATTAARTGRQGPDLLCRVGTGLDVEPGTGVAVGIGQAQVGVRVHQLPIWLMSPGLCRSAVTRIPVHVEAVVCAAHDTKASRLSPQRAVGVGRPLLTGAAVARVYVHRVALPVQRVLVGQAEPADAFDLPGRGGGGGRRGVTALLVYGYVRHAHRRAGCRDRSRGRAAALPVRVVAAYGQVEDNEEAVVDGLPPGGRADPRLGERALHPAVDEDLQGLRAGVRPVDDH